MNLDDLNELYDKQTEQIKNTKTFLETLQQQRNKTADAILNAQGYTQKEFFTIKFEMSYEESLVYYGLFTNSDDAESYMPNREFYSVIRLERYEVPFRLLNRLDKSVQPEYNGERTLDDSGR